MTRVRGNRVISNDFSLQSAQAGGEHPVVYRATGLAEAYRLLAQVTLRRWQTRSCQEEEFEEGKRWCCTGRRRRLKNYRHLLYQ